MSKAKYVIRNGDSVIGVLWENDNLGRVFVSSGEKIDINFDLEIYDCDKFDVVNNVDLREFILEVLPRD